MTTTIRNTNVPIRVINKHTDAEAYRAAGYTVLDVTSQAYQNPDECVTTTQNWDLSPFFLRVPLEQYGYEFAHGEGTVENVWQYSKLYAEHVPMGDITYLLGDILEMTGVLPNNAPYTFNPAQLEMPGAHMSWRQNGMSQTRSNRRPMGRQKPVACAWYRARDGKYYALSYIDSRIILYAPMYRDAVKRTPTFAVLKQMLQDGKKLAFRDFDGYDHVNLGMDLTDVYLDDKRILGHGFVLAATLSDALGLGL